MSNPKNPNTFNELERFESKVIVSFFKDQPYGILGVNEKELSSKK